MLSGLAHLHPVGYSGIRGSSGFSQDESSRKRTRHQGAETPEFCRYEDPAIRAKVMNQDELSFLLYGIVSNTVLNPTLNLRRISRRR